MVFNDTFSSIIAISFYQPISSKTMTVCPWSFEAHLFKLDHNHYGIWRDNSFWQIVEYPVFSLFSSLHIWRWKLFARICRVEDHNHYGIWWWTPSLATRCILTILVLEYLMITNMGMIIAGP